MNLRALARWGYLSRAAVYFLMGVFSLLLVLGEPEGKTTGPKGAIAGLMQQPLGQWILILLVVGLFSYSIWRFFQGFLGDGKREGDAKEIIHRLGYLFGGISHGLLGFYALKLFLWNQASSGNSEKKVADQLLHLPFGQFLTAAVALSIIGFGFSQFYIAWKNKFNEKISIPAHEKSWLCPICKFGLAARGFVFVLIGTFFLKAAVSYNSQEAGGIAKAWSVLREQPFGDFLILLVGLGFIAFAVYGYAESKYFKTRLA